MMGFYFYIWVSFICILRCSEGTDPTLTPTFAPSDGWSLNPTTEFSFSPSFAPTAQPSLTPSASPSLTPSEAPSELFGLTDIPSESPTVAPTVLPTIPPTTPPTFSPTLLPTEAPSTRAPSFRPTTYKPTLSPTSFPSYSKSVDDKLVYSVKQELKGINYLQYYTNQTLHNNVFIQAVVSTMRGVSANGVTVSSLAPAVSIGRATIAIQVATNMLIGYTVTIPHTAAVGYSSGEVAYNQTSQQLLEAVKNGNFTATLQAIAADKQATYMMNATSTAASTSSPQVTSNDDKGLPGINIKLRFNIIILICVVGALVVSAVVYFLIHRSGLLESVTERRNDI
eukprot:gene1619-1771_t